MPDIKTDAVSYADTPEVRLLKLAHAAQALAASPASPGLTTVAEKAAFRSSIGAGRSQVIYLAQLSRGNDGTVYTVNNNAARIDHLTDVDWVVPLDPTAWAGANVTAEVIAATAVAIGGNVAYRFWVGYSTSAVNGTAAYDPTGVTKGPSTAIQTFAESTTSNFCTRISLGSSVTLPANITQACVYFNARRSNAADTSTAQAWFTEIRVRETF